VAPCIIFVFKQQQLRICWLCYYSGMTRKDSNKHFGLIGAALIIIAFLLWAFIMPHFRKDTTDNLPAGLTNSTDKPQSAPDVPVSEPQLPNRND
jgi:hypothetical protein